MKNKLGDATNNKEIKWEKTNKKQSLKGMAVWGHLPQQQSNLSA